jgi:hypothetical protein
MRMRYTRSPIIEIAFLGVSLLLGCSSSSNAPGPKADGGDAPSDSPSEQGLDQNNPPADGAAGTTGGSDATDVASEDGGPAETGSSDGPNGDGGDAAAACAEPSACEGYQAGTPAITCLTPAIIDANVAATLQVFGHHLASASTDVAIVSLKKDGGSSVELNGTPTSGCHLKVDVPPGVTAGTYMVTASPPSLGQSNAVTLTVR